MARVEVFNPNSASVLMERVAETAFERLGLNWKSGLGDVAREVIRENAPRVEVSPVSIARELGILKKRRA
jgi:hypothetical protein